MIAAFLSIQDPRERPADKTEAADEKHALFADERSDFVAVLNLWRAAREQAAGGNRALRRWCREHFLSFVRMREWQRPARAADRHHGGAGARRRNAEPAAAGVLHQTILTGFPRRHRRARRRPHATSARAMRDSSSRRARRCRSVRRTGSWPPAWSRRSGCTRAWWRRCSRRGSSRPVRTSSGAPTARRNGSRSAAWSSRARRCRCTGAC